VLKYKEERKEMLVAINELKDIKSILEERNVTLEADIKIALGELERQRSEYQQKMEAIKGII
jgi:hypothetical protein